jgi:hypothetical protein
MKSIYSTSTWDFPSVFFRRVAMCSLVKKHYSFFYTTFAPVQHIFCMADTIFGGILEEVHLLHSCYFWIISTGNFYHKISGIPWVNGLMISMTFVTQSIINYLMVLYGAIQMAQWLISIYILWNISDALVGWMTQYAHNATAAGRILNDNINQREELREIQVAFYK